jgi:ribonuclease P protein component
VSKKVEKSAVKRNRIRRRIFESVRRLETRISKPYDIIISVFSPAFEDMPAPELSQQVEKLLAGAGIIG